MPQIIRIKNEKKRPTPPREFMGFRLDSKGLYNGKTLEHWLDMADELVMSTIVRGINPDKLSIVQTVAADRLRGLAIALNPNLFYRLTEERARCRAAIPQILGRMLGWDEPSQPKTTKASRGLRSQRRGKARAGQARIGKTRALVGHSTKGRK